MHRRQFLGLSIAAGLALGGMAGCARAKPLRFGLHPWIGYEPLYLAEEFGWLPESVSLVKGRSSSDSMSGLLKGQLDGAAITLDEALRLHDQGVDIVVVGVVDVSVGADVVMAKPSIHSLRDLKGKRIAVELSGVSGVILVEMLQRAGLGREDVVEVNLPVNEHAEAWRHGELDVSICYEPVASTLEGLGAERLFDSRQLPETIFDVLVVRNDLTGSHEEAIEDLLKAHFAGLNHLVRNQHDAVYRVATRQGISVGAVRKALSTVALPDLSANHRYLASTGRIEAVVLKLAHVMSSEGLISTIPINHRFCNPSFLPRSIT
eukprot:TRINITY_DN4718_c0_g2_i1.p1 TRINITY_DN4718_c0_g2~~TRINITY_DN4718_c0_g2_i1.p1  ORF type:complete len:320 (-),score=33.13 TRINITY_DN4718_c0_g2_i1:820-1779(-)